MNLSVFDHQVPWLLETHMQTNIISALRWRHKTGSLNKKWWVILTVSLGLTAYRIRFGLRSILLRPLRASVSSVGSHRKDKARGSEAIQSGCNRANPRRLTLAEAQMCFVIVVVAAATDAAEISWQERSVATSVFGQFGKPTKPKAARVCDSRVVNINSNWP